MSKHLWFSANYTKRKTFFMWPLLKQRRFFSSWTFRPFRIRVEKCQIFNKKCEKTKLFSSKCVICIAPIVLSKISKLKSKNFEAKKSLIQIDIRCHTYYMGWSLSKFGSEMIQSIRNDHFKILQINWIRKIIDFVLLFFIKYT